MTTSEKLYRQIKILNRNMRRLSHAEPHGGGGLSHSQISFLKAVSDNPGIYQREVGKILHIQPSAIAEATSKLIEMRFIRKERDESDGRVFLLYITEKGQEVLRSTLENKKQFESNFFNSLSKEEVETMLHLAEKTNRFLDENKL